ncbi:MAG: hypothetical protein EBS61_02980 [Betaproteobacteria bacterium]|nr:hypothetical protein [Betaproteobacteria bacterium]
MRMAIVRSTVNLIRPHLAACDRHWHPSGFEAQQRHVPCRLRQKRDDGYGHPSRSGSPQTITMRQHLLA